MADLDTIGDFISDMSDQAAAWYSIVTDKEPLIPSATIATQQLAAQPQPQPQAVQLPMIGGGSFAAPRPGHYVEPMLAGSTLTLIVVLVGAGLMVWLLSS